VCIGVSGRTERIASALSAAHPSLPLGKKVPFENLDNRRSLVVRINVADRLLAIALSICRRPPQRNLV
jgi:hypothetical protein